MIEEGETLSLQLITGRKEFVCDILLSSTISISFVHSEQRTAVS